MADHRDKHGQGGPPGEDGFSLDEIMAEFATPRHRSKTAKKLVERTLPDNILLFPGGREVDEGPDLITPPRPAPTASGARPSGSPGRQLPPRTLRWTGRSWPGTAASRPPPTAAVPSWCRRRPRTASSPSYRLPPPLPSVNHYHTQAGGACQYLQGFSPPPVEKFPGSLSRSGRFVQFCGVSPAGTPETRHPAQMPLAFFRGTM